VQHRGPGSGLSRRLLGVAALALAGFAALALPATSHQFSALDYQARAFVHLTRAPVLDPAMTGVSGLGENYGLIPLILLGIAVLWRPSRRWAVALPLLMAGTGALQLITKWAVDRPRPNLAAWGFPSGHVLSLVVFFGLITYLLATSTLPRRRRWLGSAGCLSTVLAVAFSRLYLEAHWISDVAGGFTLGLAYLLLTICLVETVARRRAGRSGSPLAQKRRFTLPTMNGEDPMSIRLSWRSEYPSPSK
jgi:undecaprenyl-diphosphatase